MSGFFLFCEKNGLFVFNACIIAKTKRPFSQNEPYISFDLINLKFDWPHYQPYFPLHSFNWQLCSMFPITALIHAIFLL
jgi:hypothetical protein